MKKYVFVSASAGTGKTFAIVVRYVSLLLSGAKPNEILALTFTNKASKEMRDRVFEVLENLDTKAYEQYLIAISEASSLDKEKILSRLSDIKAMVLRSESNILTIDSFLDSILRLFSWYVGLNNDYDILQDNKDKFLEWLFRKSDIKDLESIIKTSHDINMSLDSILQSLYDLYQKNIHTAFDEDFIVDDDLESDILALASKIQTHILLSPDSSSSAKKAVTFTNVDELLAKTWLIKDSLSQYSYFKKEKININILDNVFVKLKEKIALYMQQIEKKNLSKLITTSNTIFKHREKYKKMQGSVSFDDVTIKVFSLLQENVDNSFLYFRLDNKITHLLIDEFQDTSRLQFRILEPIIDEILAGEGVKDIRTLFFVGDVKQSIYRFRGANKNTIEYIKDKYHNIFMDSLDTNYRSAKNIIKFSNEVFKGHFDDFLEVKENKKDDGYVCILSNDKENLLESACLQVKELLKEGIEFNDIGILSFSNQMLINIEDKLVSDIPNIKILTETSSMLINNRRVMAIIEYIRYLYFQDEIYAYNFSSLISENSFEFELSELNINIKKDDIHSIVLKIINHYDLADENSLYFLDLCFGYKDIYSFIYNIDSLDVSIISKSNDGIRLMTIHKSKGLEFKHLILVDNLAKNRNNTDKLIFKQNNMDNDSIFFNQKNREYFDKEYKMIKEENKKLDYEDELNVLYVAITRAKESLYIIQKTEHSKFALLNLKNQEIGIKPQAKNNENKEIMSRYKKVSIGKYGKQDDFLEKESVHSDLSSVYFGNAIHYMLEFTNFDLSNIDESYNIMLNKYGSLLDETTLNTIKQYVYLAIENNDFLALIKKASIKKEVQFVYNNKIGIIDLLINNSTNDELIIVDYKSSSSEKKDDYIEQMRFYRNSISELFDKKTRSFLYFLGTNPLLEEVS